MFPIYFLQIKGIMRNPCVPLSRFKGHVDYQVHAWDHRILLAMHKCINYFSLVNAVVRVRYLSRCVMNHEPMLI